MSEATPTTTGGRPVRVVYTNYRGETATRTILPERIWFGTTSWHPRPQWLLDAVDLEKGALRSFAIADIRSWAEVVQP
ncbi:MAG TPA: hypothetical protein PKW35_21900 [Nannocystaceae bacterium]|nr:hypothetical protein [Nannocystaceae bacterium]